MLKKCTVVVQQVFFFFEVTVLLDLGPPCSGAWGLEGINLAGSHCVQHKFRAAHRWSECRTEVIYSSPLSSQPPSRIGFFSVRLTGDLSPSSSFWIPTQFKYLMSAYTTWFCSFMSIKNKRILLIIILVHASCFLVAYITEMTFLSVSKKAGWWFFSDPDPERTVLVLDYILNYWMNLPTIIHWAIINATFIPAPAMNI